MGQKLLWLKARLIELGKTPTALARYLEIDPPRVYEMITGRRHMQPHEIAPTAEFLEWDLDEIMKRLPPNARFVPHVGKGTKVVREQAELSIRKTGRSVVITITGIDIKVKPYSKSKSGNERRKI